MKRAWQDRYDELSKTYPSIENIDWGSAFRSDTDLFTAVVADLIKAEGRGSLPGKRPSLDKDEAASQLSKLMQEDYSNRDFFETFEVMVGNRSVRSVAGRTGLGKSYIYQLLNKERNPSFSAMEKIAKGFRKDPSFFLEYRIGYILFNMDRFLTEYPDMATTCFIKVKKSSRSRHRMT